MELYYYVTHNILQVVHEYESLNYFDVLRLSPADNHAVDFPATFDVDSGNIVRGNAAAGSTRIAFRFAGESCVDDNRAPTGDEV